MNRVRLGVIGCGSMSRYHGHMFTHSVPEAEIVALVEPDASNLARYIAEVFTNQPAPATFTTRNATDDAARRAETPHAAARVWMSEPTAIPNALARPAFRPWAMLRPRM